MIWNQDQVTVVEGLAQVVSFFHMLI